MSEKPKETKLLHTEIAQLKKRIAELEETEKKGKEAMLALQNTEDTLESIFRVAPAGIGMIRNRIFVEINPLVSKITGYSREELIGKNCRIIYANDTDYEKVGTDKYKQIEQYGTGTIETVWQTKDGELVDILLSSTPIDAKDMQKGVIFTALDISERNKSRNALLNTEERLKAIFENAPDAIYLSDLKGNFIDLNSAAEKLVGHNKRELIGKNFSSLKSISNNDLIKAAEFLATNALGKKTGPDIFTLDHENNGGIPVEISTYPVVINKQKLSLGIVSDLTAQVKAEELKYKNQQLLKFHVNQTPLAVIEWDLNFKVKSWNPAAENIFGFTQTEAIGQHASFFIPEATVTHVDQIWMEVLMLKGTKKSTNTNRRKNGEIITCEWHNTPLINEQGEVVAVASFASNVSKRTKSEDIQKVVYNISNATNTTDNLNNLITKIQEELATIIDTTNFYIALYDKSNDTLSLPFFADEKDQFTNFPAGKTLTSYVIRNKAPLLATQNIITELEQKGEIEAVGSDSEIWLGVPLEIEGKVIGVLALQSYDDANAYTEDDLKMIEFVSDQISLSIHRKNTEVEIQKALEKAKESDRLKSAFLANMSHEIRTPMNGILGFSNLLKDENIETKERLQYVSIIEKSGKRMLGIINDLIDISKIESGMTEVALSDFNLNTSLEYVYEFFKPETQAKGIQLTCSKGFENDLSVIKSDREKVYAVLINLVKNAIKYTKSGNIDFGYKQNNNTIQFFVQDTGIGIPKDKLNSIFNRFVQVDLKFSTSLEGVGLGLAITKAYIELLGGKIWVESEHTIGSKFFFEIPYITGDKKKNTEEMEKTIMDEKPKMKLKILIAEDDIINQKLFSYILKEIAHELILTSNGAEAVEKFKETSDIDLVLMDLKMPEMDGHEATSRIRDLDKEVTIIALSAFALESERKKALENGFNAYVSKPVSKVDLFKAIGNYFDI